ncbi:MAG TPA: hypothetical protein VD736_10175 [Nitrososphaera sp.]|nr:hypothetical protein [Nitrososphaera sp.]
MNRQAGQPVLANLNMTKRLFLLIILSFVIIVPLTHVITTVVIGETIFDQGGPPFRNGPPDNPSFRIVQAVVVGTVLVWIGIGIRQWFVLSKWTKKYKQFKELQKEVDEKLDYDESNEKQP